MPLEGKEIIPFESIEKILIDKNVYKPNKGKTGRPSIPSKILVGSLFLQNWYGLSDPMTEELIHDRISFRKFLDIKGRVTMPLLVLHDKLTTIVNKMLNDKYQLSDSELDVLASLRYSGDEDYKLSPTRLYELLLFSSGGMTKVLKKLENKKYIRRLNNPGDGRSKLVQLTKTGNDIVDESIADVMVIEEEIFSHVNKEELETLSKLLFKVLEQPE